MLIKIIRMFGLRSQHLCCSIAHKMLWGIFILVSLLVLNELRFQRLDHWLLTKPLIYLLFELIKVVLALVLSSIDTWVAKKILYICLCICEVFYHHCVTAQRNQHHYYFHCTTASVCDCYATLPQELLEADAQFYQLLSL